jgi:NAD(P)-dependent dehydrogenase (short-subunit alcohol dehydrogenase family)
MADRLNGKIAILFGAGSVGPEWGNGKATAVLFARNGAHVACVDVNREAAQETLDIIRGESGAATAFACDVTIRRP